MTKNDIIAYLIGLIVIDTAFCILNGFKIIEVSWWWLLATPFFPLFGIGI